MSKTTKKAQKPVFTHLQFYQLFFLEILGFYLFFMSRFSLVICRLLERIFFTYKFIFTYISSTFSIHDRISRLYVLLGCIFVGPTPELALLTYSRCVQHEAALDNYDSTVLLRRRLNQLDHDEIPD